MMDIPDKAIDAFGTTGGILGLVILGLLCFMVWYIHSSRKHHSDENVKLVGERKDWQAALDRNTAALHSVEKAVLTLTTRPCLRSPNSRTRETDRMLR